MTLGITFKRSQMILGSVFWKMNPVSLLNPSYMLAAIYYILTLYLCKVIETDAPYNSSTKFACTSNKEKHKTQCDHSSFSTLQN